MEDRSGVIRSSTGTGYLVLHTVDERALHLTNALACTFDQHFLVRLWTTEASAGSETVLLQETHSLLHMSYKTLCRCGRVSKTSQTDAEAVEQLTILKLSHPYPPLPVLAFPVIWWLKQGRGHAVLMKRFWASAAWDQLPLHI